MTARAGLDALLEEQRGLNESMLQSTLQALGQAEQSRILELLEAKPLPPLDFETLAGISPWLMKRIEAAGSPTTCRAAPSASRSPNASPAGWRTR